MTTGKGTAARSLGQRSRQERQSLRLGLGVVAGIGLIVLAGAWSLDWGSGLGGGVQEGDPAPPFVLEDSAGRHVALADYLGRKPIVFVFYMTYG